MAHMYSIPFNNSARHFLLIEITEKIFLVIMILGWLSGCTHYVYVNPNPTITGSHKKYPLKVGIFIESQQLTYTHSQSGSCLTGVANTWNVPVGAALHKASLRAFGHLFADVKSIASLEDGKDNSLNIIFVPSIRAFRISEMLTTEFSLRATLLDSSQQVIYEKEIHGQSPGGRSCLMSIISTNEAFSISVNLAFEDAFEKLLLDISRSLDFSETHEH